MSASKPFFTTALLVAVAACGSSNANGPNATGRQIAFQLATQAAAPAPASLQGLSTPETITLGSDIIVLDRVQVVLRRVELERNLPSATCDTVAGSDDDCEDLDAGPILLDIPLGAGAARQFTVAIDTGTFNQIKFQIHKPESSDDAGFLAQNPGWDGVSIRATGTFNGSPFTYESDLDVDQEAGLNPPLTVTDNAGAALTLFVDLSTWFANSTATGLIDPASANNGQPNEGEVKSNIEGSFNAFEDHDRDGADDHGGV